MEERQCGARAAPVSYKSIPSGWGYAFHAFHIAFVKDYVVSEELPKPEKKFILSGIFFSANGAYALVNNQIVRENDLVDGAKVGKITVNSVELNNEGKIITLSTNR